MEPRAASVGGVNVPAAGTPLRGVGWVNINDPMTRKQRLVFNEALQAGKAPRVQAPTVPLAKRLRPFTDAGKFLHHDERRTVKALDEALGNGVGDAGSKPFPPTRERPQVTLGRLRAFRLQRPRKPKVTVVYLHFAPSLEEEIVARSKNLADAEVNANNLFGLRKFYLALVGDIQVKPSFLIQSENGFFRLPIARREALAVVVRNLNGGLDATGTGQDSQALTTNFIVPPTPQGEEERFENASLLARPAIRSCDRAKDKAGCARPKPESLTHQMIKRALKRKAAKDSIPESPIGSEITGIAKRFHRIENFKFGVDFVTKRHSNLHSRFLSGTCIIQDEAGLSRATPLSLFKVENKTGIQS